MNEPTAFDPPAPSAIGTASTPCHGSGHPLESIAFFRRFKPSAGRDLLYTFIWNVGFAVAFTVLALLFDPDARLARAFWINFVVANCVGFLIHLGFSLSHRLLGDSLRDLSVVARSIYYSIVSIAGVFGGYWLGFTLLSWDAQRRWVFSAQGAIAVLLLSLTISGILASLFYARERQARAEAVFHSERARVAAAERQIKVAELKLLQAQVEPHFLYNTLANVVSLIDADPGKAKRLVERFIDYLRRAAAATTGAESTLGGQVELLRAYLDLIGLRVGPRLRYTIDVPSELASLALPPMLLQPLAENAVKHGIEPATYAGEVVVSARLTGERLVLTVADNGVGVSSTRSGDSTGLGLANLRERLATLYGPLAALKLEDRRPGTRATVTLPAVSR
ncbi:MAG TPA: histidine kinase [Casimicrobiaceae bacterium]|nr:histidine kinase [Casimicrobiaceae bacterium]